ncbi:MAG TPA: glycosyl hydrolase family 8 [Vicinamibacteria bacterium]|nr:glycosyl hydrolase family 8 [Vicinamibacteria bacterium]
MRRTLAVVVACLPAAAQADELLRETWSAYVRRFVKANGRVVDPKAGGITTSEGQAYAMLRAVWVDDRAVFDRAHAWAVEHLNRGARKDRLWAWKWDGRVVDTGFASDADQDAALALLLAARAWNDDTYLRRAREMLADLWARGTLVAGGRRFLLGGDTLCKAGACRVNPSYYAPYAYRYFAREDPAHDWTTLVDTSYLLLERNAALTATRLPSDWLLLDTTTGALSLGSEKDSRYSYDAFRAHWRIRLDGILFDEPRARAYLADSLAWLAERYRKDRRLPAIILRDGRPGADYEALEMLASLAPALRESAPDVADALKARLEAALADGLWGDRDSYYLQNWAWFATALERGALTPFARLGDARARGAGP